MILKRGKVGWLVATLGLMMLSNPGTASAGRAERLGAAAAGIRRLDTDRDGRLSRAEHTAGARKLFDNMDANRDGKATAAEVDNAYRRMKGRRPSRSMKARNLNGADRVKLMDRDRDGAISVEEYTVDALVAFDKMDHDKDGVVTKAELAANHGKVLRKGRTKRR
ncbi:MAG TPA: hypothetical protein VGF45_07170 [Polyangia bacterium]